MKISLEQVKSLLEVQELAFFKSTTSKRLVAYNPPKHSTTFLVMTNDGKFDEKKEIYATILTPSEEYAWVADYDFVVQISNKAGSEPVMKL